MPYQQIFFGVALSRRYAKIAAGVQISARSGIDIRDIYVWFQNWFAYSSE